MNTPANAFAALRAAGLTITDPDCVAVFDIDAPDFVAQAKAKKPEWFGFDARTASAAAVAARLAELDPGTNRNRLATHTAATMAALRKGR